MADRRWSDAAVQAAHLLVLNEAGPCARGRRYAHCENHDSRFPADKICCREMGGALAQAARVAVVAAAFTLIDAADELEVVVTYESGQERRPTSKPGVYDVVPVRSTIDSPEAEAALALVIEWRTRAFGPPPTPVSSNAPAPATGGSNDH